ncbi:MAG: hypothetical protein DRG27_04370 [Deltaproteobacteria bacterium]|nr:MAG: hypothetical protein DRG27_04370 [Deltaproteobacteria bacterium]
MTSIFEKIYQDYLEYIKKIDLEKLSERINSKVVWNGKELIIPLFSKKFFISKQGIKNSSGKDALHTEIVVLSKYIIGFPSEEIKDKGKWKHYRDFKDAAPLLSAFYNNVEKKIATTFSGKKELLIECSKRLGGTLYDEGWNYDISLLFCALPHIPVLLLFNEADELFPAQCIILFRETVEHFLDMESVAILGLILTEYLLSQLRSLQ